MCRRHRRRSRGRRRRRVVIFPGVLLPLVAVGVRGSDTVDDDTLLGPVEQMAVAIRGGVALGVDFAVEDGIIMNDGGRDGVL